MNSFPVKHRFSWVLWENTSQPNMEFSRYLCFHCCTAGGDLTHFLKVHSISESRNGKYLICFLFILLNPIRAESIIRMRTDLTSIFKETYPDLRCDKKEPMNYSIFLFCLKSETLFCHLVYCLSIYSFKKMYQEIRFEWKW